MILAQIFRFIRFNTFSILFILSILLTISSLSSASYLTTNSDDNYSVTERLDEIQEYQDNVLATTSNQKSNINSQTVEYNLPDINVNVAQLTQHNISSPLTNDINYNWESTVDTSVAIDESNFNLILENDPNKGVTTWNITSNYITGSSGSGTATNKVNSSTNRLTTNLTSQAFGLYALHSFSIADWTDKSLPSPTSSPMSLSLDIRTGDFIIPNEVEVYFWIRLQLTFLPNKTLFPSSGPSYLTFYFLVSDFYNFPAPDSSIPGTNYTAENASVNEINVFSSNQTSNSWEHVDLNITQTLEVLYPNNYLNSRELYSELSEAKFEIESVQNTTENSYLRSFSVELDNLTVSSQLEPIKDLEFEITSLKINQTAPTINSYDFPLQQSFTDLTSLSINPKASTLLDQYNATVTGYFNTKVNISSNKEYELTPDTINSTTFKWNLDNPLTTEFLPDNYGTSQFDDFSTQQWIYWHLPTTWDYISSSNFTFVNVEESPLQDILGIGNTPLYQWWGGFLINPEIYIEFHSINRLTSFSTPYSVIENQTLELQGYLDSQSIQSIIRINTINSFGQLTTIWISSAPDGSFSIITDFSTLGITSGNNTIELIVSDPVWYSYWNLTYYIQDGATQPIEEDHEIKCSLINDYDTEIHNNTYSYGVEITAHPDDFNSPVYLDWNDYEFTLKVDSTKVADVKLNANNTDEISGLAVLSGKFPFPDLNSEENLTLHFEINQQTITGSSLVWEQDLLVTVNATIISLITMPTNNSPFQNVAESMPLYISVIGATALLGVLKKRKTKPSLAKEI